MQRRDFIRRTASGIAILGPLSLAASCGRQVDGVESNLAEDEEFVTLYDTYAMALYYDGGLGPKTGTIKVADVLAGQQLDLKFWHGHGGKDHRFSVLPEHFLKLRNSEKVTIETTEVDNHSHKLFIDMQDKRWRVPGAEPVKVPRKPSR